MSKEFFENLDLKGSIDWLKGNFITILGLAVIAGIVLYNN